MGRRRPLLVCGDVGGSGAAWTTILDVDFAGAAGSAVANGGTISRGGITWTLRAQSAADQTWTPGATGITVAAATTNGATNALNADITAAGLLGRNPDDYDLLAVQALWAAVTSALSFGFFGVHMGKSDLSVVRGGVQRGLMAGHARSTAANWFSRLSTSGGLVSLERSAATGLGDPSGVPIVTGGIFSPGIGVQMFGTINRATLYDAPADARPTSVFREVLAAERPALDRVGAIAITSTTTGTTGILSRMRVQHLRLPGAPAP
jgi:hypothetical protein